MDATKKGGLQEEATPTAMKMRLLLSLLLGGVLSWLLGRRHKALRRGRLLCVYLRLNIGLRLEFRCRCKLVLRHVENELHAGIGVHHFDFAHLDGDILLADAQKSAHPDDDAVDLAVTRNYDV